MNTNQRSKNKEDESSAITMGHVISVLPQMYPYLPKEQLGVDLFKQQCYFVTHLILVLSKYGRLRLPHHLFRAEYKLLYQNMQTIVDMNDPELVGEFVDCLAILGATERDLTVLLGRRYLLKLEIDRGGNGRWTDTDAHFYRHYHTSWCGVVGLMEHAFSGNGPM